MILEEDRPRTILLRNESLENGTGFFAFAESGAQRVTVIIDTPEGKVVAVDHNPHHTVDTLLKRLRTALLYPKLSRPVPRRDDDPVEEQCA